MKDFYVYVHRKATTGEIFYVGKGRRHRATERGSRRSEHWNRTVAKHGFLVEFVARNLTEEMAFDLEHLLIQMVGRIDTKTGSLVNKTEGGEGTTGATYIMSEERKANIRRAALGRYVSPETRAKQSQAQKGRTHSDEVKAKIAEGQRRRDPSTFGKRPKVAVVRDNAIVYEGSKTAEDMLLAEGRATADRSNIVKCCNGKIKSVAGSTWRHATPEEAAALKEKGASWAPLSDLQLG